ncbi:MAG: hypothetical protein AB1938_27955 [Myxococcota bacterium]
MRGPLPLAAFLFCACNVGTSPDAGLPNDDGGADAGLHDAGAPDAGYPDTGPSDGGLDCPPGFDFPTCAPPGTPSRSWCDTALEVTPDAGTLRRDTSTGGYGDCAITASGIGGPSLYFSVPAPAGRTTRFMATPLAANERVLLRRLERCGGQASWSSIVAASDGGVGYCFRNTDGDTRLLFAVSRYSGEAFCEALTFDVRVEVTPDDSNCHVGEFP